MQSERRDVQEGGEVCEAVGGVKGGLIRCLLEHQYDPDDPYSARTGYVYFISWGEENPVKIGWSHTVGKRLISLQTSFPFDLKVLGVIPGYERLEKEIHQLFSEDRIRGEWFRWTDRLAQLIDESEKEYEKWVHGSVGPVKLSVKRVENSLSDWWLEVIDHTGYRYFATKNKELAFKFVETLDEHKHTEVLVGADALRARGILDD